MIKAVIFDMWDTTVPSTIDFDEVAKFAKAEHLPRSELLVRYERTVQLKKYNNFSELHRDFIAAFNKEPHELLEKELHEVYFKRMGKVGFFPEVKSVLLSLREKGFKLGLLSNTENLPVDHIEKKIHISKYFDAVCYSFDIQVLKPDKIAFDCILSKLNVKPSEALMVGDSLRADIGGAKKVGMHNCLINRSGKVINYSAIKPEFEIKSLNELKKVLGDLNGGK